MSPLLSLIHWNYRVVKQIHGTPEGDPEVVYGIHECYYDPTGWTAEPVQVTAESVDGLRDQLHRMLMALEIEAIDDGGPHD